MIKGIVPNKSFKTVSELPVIVANTYQINVADKLVINFLNELSKNILKNPFFRGDASFIALGFWLRRTNINRILKENDYAQNNNVFITRPLGKIFHLCPSNVDTMFIYSLVLALLAGNKNIVRISSKLESESIFNLFKLINNLLSNDSYKLLSDYINVITYERSHKINEELSLNVNGRIIWGGDETVNQFKNYKTKSKVKDLFFTDKVSHSIIKVNDLVHFNNNFEILVRNLYNDIYTFNQKGCSSPHSLFIVSENLDKKVILDKIYIGLSNIAEQDYEEDISSIASLKLNQSVVDIIEDKINETKNSSNYITFSKLNTHTVPHSCGAGYLYYQLLQNLDNVSDYIDLKTQTITYYGLEKKEIKSFLDRINVESVDRIVPLGKALEFDYIWDGYNIFLEMLSFKSIK